MEFVYLSVGHVYIPQITLLDSEGPTEESCISPSAHMLVRSLNDAVCNSKWKDE